jgi:hypothetical protein
MWDRQLVEAVFGFRYRWEIYVPADKRQYGYYVLPLIYSDGFAGRVEAIARREEGALEVRGVWLEPGVRYTKALETALDGALRRLARFNGCAAVVRHDQHERRSLTDLDGDIRLDPAADVAGQQQSSAGAFHQQHAGAIVCMCRIPIRRKVRTEHAETNAVPFPPLTGTALRRADLQALRFATRTDRIGKCPCDRRRATGVVVVAMADDEAIDSTDAVGTHGRQHGGFAEVEAGGIARPGVEQQCVRMRAHEYGQPLPHVDHVGLECAIRRHRSRR